MITLWEYVYSDELYHHGVKGMKWGVRKKQPPTSVEKAKSDMKSSYKEYNKAFNKAYNYSLAAYSPLKKHREANDKRWQDAADKAEKYKESKKMYKLAKQKYKDAVKQRSKEILAGESFLGKAWDITTGGHKIQAEIEVALKERGYD